MGSRIELQALLVALLGSAFVYHQPPPSKQMEYPCIVYKRDDILMNHADNMLYKRANRYQITVIDRNPDSLIPDQIADLPMCSFDRAYTADNLNHHVFNLFF